MRSGLSPSSSSARTPARHPKDGPVEGLPAFSYLPPIIATLLATLLVIAVTAVLSFFAFSLAVVQFGQTNAPGGADSAILNGGVCGLLALGGAAITFYFIMALIKGLRDLRSPVFYARGTVVDKRVLGGRRAGTWMGVGVRYLGPDLATASEVTDDQRSASPDRSKMLQPRFSGSSSYLRPGQGSAAPSPRTKRSAYIPSDRLSTSQSLLSREPRDPAIPRVVFRVDPASFDALEPDEEILIAHSRYLQHIYYVAHLRGGEWESYRNKQLI